MIMSLLIRDIDGKEYKRGEKQMLKDVEELKESQKRMGEKAKETWEHHLGGELGESRFTAIAKGKKKVWE